MRFQPTASLAALARGGLSACRYACRTFPRFHTYRTRSTRQAILPYSVSSVHCAHTM